MSLCEFFHYLCGHQDLDLMLTSTTVTPERVECFEVEVFDDNILENNESYSLVLMISEAERGVLILEQSSSFTDLTIIDNDGKFATRHKL